MELLRTYFIKKNRGRQQFASEFSEKTGSDMNLSPLALKHEIDHCRKLIDEIACAFRAAKTPRAKNEVKAWAGKLLEHITAKLSHCQTSDSAPSSGSSGGKNFQLETENILLLAERELKKVVLISRKIITINELRLRWNIQTTQSRMKIFELLTCFSMPHQKLSPPLSRVKYSSSFQTNDIFVKISKASNF